MNTFIQQLQAAHAVYTASISGDVSVLELRQRTGLHMREVVYWLRAFKRPVIRRDDTILSFPLRAPQQLSTLQELPL